MHSLLIATPCCAGRLTRGSPLADDGQVAGINAEDCHGGKLSQLGGFGDRHTLQRGSGSSNRRERTARGARGCAKRRRCIGARPKRAGVGHQALHVKGVRGRSACGWVLC